MERRTSWCLALTLIAPLATTSFATDGYQAPPADVVAIVDAPRTPSMMVAPNGRVLVRAHGNPMPTIAEVAEPMLKLAGARINPDRNERKSRGYITHFELQDVATGNVREVKVPEGGRLGSPMWAPDSRRFAFTRSTPSGVELWICDVRTAEARQLTKRHLNAAAGSPMSWWSGSDRLLVRLIPRDRGEAPATPAVPSGPIVAETSKRAATVRTYQDLLQNPHDEALFDHYFTTQLGWIDLDGEITEIGAPGIFRGARVSPDGKRILVTRIEGPYSYSVPMSSFAQTTEVWDTTGRAVHAVSSRPISDEVPIGGVITGPRSVTWQAHHPATLVWAEALDGGDPKVEVPHRDKLMTLAGPFDGAPAELMRTELRFGGLTWTDRMDEALVSERDRKTRWTRSTLRRFGQPGAEPIVLTDRSYHDRYADPGRPITHRLADGMSVIWIHDGAMYLSGSGASPEGQRPFLDRFVISSAKTERLFHSPLERYTSFVAFARDESGDANGMIMRRESPTEPPNYFHVESEGERPEWTALTDFPDPHPQLTGIKKELVQYTREDGVPLSGTLYLPADYEPGTRLPLVIWAYPIEYSSAAVAGQVRSTTNRFTRLSSTSPLMFLTQGYAVLDGAAMPVVGDSETMNDTFIDQIVMSAKAAIDAMVEKGVADPDRVGVGGHSYGAFMTANLLAHSDLFQAGIARSGAYNRSLTPFGFQSERRTVWEATDTYVKVSPFFHANQLKEPILLIHGDEDNNSGTFPVQSKRLFHALQGLGGTARYVRLPEESHGYSARESVLHTLAESFGWFDQHVKNASKTPEG